MKKLRNALSTLLAVLLVLCGAYAIGGHVARRVADREKEIQEAERNRRTQKELNDVTFEVDRMEKGHAAAELGRRWVRD